MIKADHFGKRHKETFPPHKLNTKSDRKNWEEIRMKYISPALPIQVHPGACSLPLGLLAPVGAICFWAHFLVRPFNNSKSFITLMKLSVGYPLKSIYLTIRSTSELHHVAYFLFFFFSTRSSLWLAFQMIHVQN